MKSPLAILITTFLPILAEAEDGFVWLRRTDAKTSVVWDMPVGENGFPSKSDLAGQRPAFYQQWRIAGEGRESLMDQCLAGACFPAVQLKVRTLDPDGATPRTRVDQPFNVEIEISGLLSQLDLPLASSRLLLERRLESRTAGIPKQPISSAYLCDNGRTMIPFPASALTAKDPTKARGKEVFSIHVLSGAGKLPSLLSSASLHVFPVASGEIRGIRGGEKLTSMPELEISLHDLYPDSETHLLLFKGRQFNGIEPIVVTSHSHHGSNCEDRTLRVSDLSSKVTSAGFHTLALVSDTIYGRELLCDPITFQSAHPATVAPDLARSSQP